MKSGFGFRSRKNSLDKRNDADKERTKELEKHAKLIKASTIDAVISSGEGNYNSFNKGKAGDSVGSKMNLTGMTVGQIRDLQREVIFLLLGNTKRFLKHFKVRLMLVLYLVLKSLVQKFRRESLSSTLLP